MRKTDGRIKLLVVLPRPSKYIFSADGSIYKNPRLKNSCNLRILRSRSLSSLFQVSFKSLSGLFQVSFQISPKAKRKRSVYGGETGTSGMTRRYVNFPPFNLRAVQFHALPILSMSTICSILNRKVIGEKVERNWAGIGEVVEG